MELIGGLLVHENVKYINTVHLIEPEIQISQSQFLLVYHKIIHKHCHHQQIIFLFHQMFQLHCHILQNMTTVFSYKHGL